MIATSIRSSDTAVVSDGEEGSDQAIGNPGGNQTAGASCRSEPADFADICVKRANAVHFVRQASSFPVNLQESNAPAVVEFPG
jgi:hypothetical protein